MSLLDFSYVLVITDTSIKNNIVIFITHIYVQDKPVIKIIYYTVNVLTTEVKLFAIRCSINFFFLSQQFITRGAMAVHAYRRNYVWSINTLTFLYSYST